VIHDRYRQRLFAYTRQMLPHRQDAEDALQDIFVRAYSGLRANQRELALRAWLYRVAHNRCIDELRRPAPPPPEVIELLRSPVHDPIAQADQRESLRRLIADVRRLPDQQRSALLMRELGGMSYADMAGALGVTVPAVKSLLVRARLALAQALEARDTACSDIREELILSHDRGLRPNATARRHMRDCDGCQEFRHQLRGVSRRFGAIVPTLGPLGVLANMLGIGGAGSGAAGGALAAGGAAGTGTAVVGVGTMGAGAAHVATMLAAAVVTAGGAVELQQAHPAAAHQQGRARAVATAHTPRPVVRSTAVTSSGNHAPAVTERVLIVPARPDPAPAVGEPAQTSNSSAAKTKLKPSSSTTTTRAHKKAPPATGGISVGTGAGGVSPSDPANGTTGSTDSSTTTSSTGTASSGTGSTTAAGSTTGETTSSTQPGTSTTAGSTPPASTGATTGTSSTTGTATATGSPTGTANTGSPPATP
jgi:RNA polymerase sigma factor (sigma-70 family)